MRASLNKPLEKCDESEGRLVRYPHSLFKRVDNDDGLLIDVPIVFTRVSCLVNERGDRVTHLASPTGYLIKSESVSSRFTNVASDGSYELPAKVRTAKGLASDFHQLVEK